MKFYYKYNFFLKDKYLLINKRPFSKNLFYLNKYFLFSIRIVAKKLDQKLLYCYLWDS